ncbi:MAG: phenylalanine--tRNA ligase subunit alpha [Pyrodictiaceae archaeon]
MHEGSKRFSRSSPYERTRGLFCRSVVTVTVMLSESEYELLKRLQGRIKPGKRYTTDELARITGMDKSRVEALVRLLAEKGLASIERKEEQTLRPTSEAQRYLKEGFPEERLIELLKEAGGRLPLNRVRGLMEDADIAITNAARKNWIRIVDGNIVLNVKEAIAEERRLLESILRGKPISEREIRLLKRRRLIEQRKAAKTIVLFPKDPSEIVAEAEVVVGALTSEIISSGLWRRVKLRPYNVRASPPRVYPGRLHFMKEFIEFVRDVMREMGFIEVEAQPVETEFWNYDVLFQPQYHPAREPTDTFYLANPSKGIVPSHIAERVARLHEDGTNTRGWGYKWDPDKAANLILRSHTTAVSARVLASKPNPPFRFFTIGKVYRVENIDASHLLEFHQLDGIASEEEMSFRDLLGILGEFFERLGIREYRFRPAYFPFTEPSAEASVRIGDRWIEVLGCGMFRPEVLEALGVDYPVAAWGMGLERIAMTLYGINDIRDLYTSDVAMLREMPVRWWIYARTNI